MTIKELKEHIQSLPDDAVVIMEGRWGETFDIRQVELIEPTEINEFKTKVAYLS